MRTVNLCRCSGISLRVHRSIAEFILSRARAGRIDDAVVLDLRCAETRPLSQLKQHHIPVCVLCAQRGFGRRAHAGLERDVLHLRLRAGRPGGCCAACNALRTAAERSAGAAAPPSAVSCLSMGFFLSVQLFPSQSAPLRLFLFAVLTKNRERSLLPAINPIKSGEILKKHLSNACDCGIILLYV